MSGISWYTNPLWYGCAILIVIMVAIWLIWWQSKRIANRLQKDAPQNTTENQIQFNTSKRSDYFVFIWFIIGATVIVFALFSSASNETSSNNDSTIITVLSIFVTFLVAWQIWATINTNRIVDRFDERIRTVENNFSNIGSLIQSQNGLNEAQRIIFNIINDPNRGRAHEYAMAYLHSCDSLLRLMMNKLEVEEVIDNCLTIMDRILINAQGILDNDAISQDIRTRLHREFTELNSMISNLESAIRRYDKNIHSQQLDNLHQRRVEILRWTPPTSNNLQPTQG